MMIDHNEPAVAAIADDALPDLPEPVRTSYSDSAVLYHRADQAHQAAYFTKGFAIACAISLEPERGAIADYAREVKQPYSTVHEEYSCYARLRKMDKDMRQDIMRWINVGVISYTHVRECLGIKDDDAFYGWLKASHDGSYTTRKLNVEKAAARASADVLEGVHYEPGDVPEPDNGFVEDEHEPSYIKAPRSCVRCLGTGREPEDVET